MTEENSGKNTEEKTVIDIAVQRMREETLELSTKLKAATDALQAAHARVRAVTATTGGAVGWTAIGVMRVRAGDWRHPHDPAATQQCSGCSIRIGVDWAKQHDGLCSVCAAVADARDYGR